VYGTPTLVGLLERTARAMGQNDPTVRVLVGDLSAKSGGRISGHASHQSGLDVDVALFYKDADGNPFVPTRYITLNEQGASEDGTIRLDSDRMWRFTELLLRDAEADVQYIFLYKPLIVLTLEAGRRAGAHQEMLRRAETVLTQPGDSSPHAEHMHIRIYCPRDDEEKLCQTTGPVRDWVRDRVPPPEEGLEDEPLVDLEEIPEEARVPDAVLENQVKEDVEPTPAAAASQPVSATGTKLIPPVRVEE
jgi:penicillin-insensitive murein endopeptidase